MSDEKKGGASKLIIVIGVVIIILLVAVIVILLLKKPDEAVVDRSAGSTGREVVSESSRMVLDEQSAQNAMEEMRKEVEEGMFECNMSMTWTFENGDAESKDAYVANSKNNYRPIYFDVVLEDTGEVVYSSPILPVGSSLTNFKLDKHLAAGTYRAVCDYTLILDEETQEPMSAAGFVITIIVEND